MKQRHLAPEPQCANGEIFKRIFVCNCDAIFVFNRENPPTILDCNQAATRLFGYSRYELLNSDVLCLCADELSMREFQRIFSSDKYGIGRLDLSQLRMKRADGTLLITEHSIYPLTSDNGTHMGWVDTVRDVQSLMQKMGSAGAAIEQLETAVCSAKEGILGLDSEATITYVNPAALTILGYSLDELVGSNLCLICHSHRRDINLCNKDKCPVCASCRSGMSTAHYREVFWKKGGEALEVEYQSTPVLERGKVVGATVVFSDITEQLKAENDLRETAEFNQTLLENSSNPIIVVNPDTSIRYINRAFEKLTGYSSPEIIGQKAPYPWWPKNEVDKDYQALSRNMRGKVDYVAYCFRNKFGNPFWVQINSKPVTSSKGLKYYLATWTDVTEYRRLRENMQYYVSEITRAQEGERKRIARELHDDTAQTLSSLFLDIAELEMMSHEMPYEAIKTLQRMKGKIDGCIEEIRRISHSLRPGLLDRLGLVASLELLVEEMNHEAGLECALNVIGDRRRISPEAELVLFRVAQEALNNVKKHARASKVKVKLELGDKNVSISIYDNGIGFRIPKPLSNLAPSGKLGLMGVVERVRLLSGEVHLQSRIRRGTKIKAILPMKT
jgi:PAS domain S-box-containing protein